MVQSNPYRTHPAGALRLHHVGMPVVLSGWAQSLRRFKSHAFLELREASGCVQVVLSPAQAEGLTEESAVRIQGQVAARKSPHPSLSAYPTGQVEVVASCVEVLGPATVLPFSRHESPAEEQMLRHRTLALRWPAHQHPLRARAAAVSAMRAVAQAEGFLEVETPVLVRATPGGAAPFLVPTAPGQGYALAQSPQVWKQLLVCGGIERYYQLAHCFRNEGARPERQPEFSQFEIEMAFATAPMVQQVMEQMVQAAARAVGPGLAPVFPRMTYLQALARYGSEKPHLGNPLRLRGPRALASERFSQGEVALPLPRALTRQEQATWLPLAWEGVGPAGEILLPSGNRTIVARGPLETVQLALGRLRTLIAEAWGLVVPGLFPVWLEQCPLFEALPEGGWASAHHPFTRPLAGQESQWQHPSTMLAEAFDLVLNGQEVGGGSMRIHEPGLQRQVFSTLGWPQTESQEHFRPLLEALELGAPPHGGMALGVERLLATLLGLPHIRAVMAFPKTAGGQCLLTQALGPLP